MNLSIRTRLVAASAAALLCLPASSWAGFSSGSWSSSGDHFSYSYSYGAGSSSGSWSAGGSASSGSDRDDDFLSRSMREMHQSKPPKRYESFEHDEKPGSWSTSYAQGGSLPRFLRGDSDVAIWNLISLVCAQRDGKFLDELKVALHDLWKYQNTNTPPVSPVPLPGSVWMMLMGLLGLAGARITGVSGGNTAARSAGGDAAPERHGELVPA